MGKKGSWFSAIKRVFTHSSEGSENKSGKEKKKGRGLLRHGETKSFIPLFRKPSSVEKILGEADQLQIRPPASFEHTITLPSLTGRPASPRASSPKAASRKARSPKAASPRAVSLREASPKAASPRAASPRTASAKAVSPRAASPKAVSPRAASPKAVSPRAASPKAASPKVASSRVSSAKAAASSRAPPPPPQVNQTRKELKCVPYPELTLRNQHLSATKIQAVYRGYLARRNFRALRGLVRLQGVVRGQNVRRQTMNAMKQMQLLVRLQTQIQSRRIQMIENQALQHQAYGNDKEVESTLSRLTSNLMSGAGNHEDWDDSLLTKVEVEARLHKRVEAVIKRERALAYAYSQQGKANSKSLQTARDIQANGFPWWWNWLEHKLPPANSSQIQNAATSVTLTPPRPISEYKPSSRLRSGNYSHKNFSLNNHESSSPRSSRSAVPVRGKQYRTPSRTPPPAKPSPLTKYSRLSRPSPAHSTYNLPLKDDDSLMSCPPFSVPNYMAPTVSAAAKARANSNPKERIPSTPGNDSKRRFSFPLTQNVGSFKWSKGSNKDATSQKVLGKHQSMGSVGDLSMDSAVSTPATSGRKPFNRFV